MSSPKLLTIMLDAHGRLPLAALWRLAGSPPSRRPAEWARQHKALILKTHTGAKVEPVRSIRGGEFPGTWATPPLARAYACWLAPRFHAWRRWGDYKPDTPDAEFWLEWSSQAVGWNR